MTTSSKTYNQFLKQIHIDDPIEGVRVYSSQPKDTHKSSVTAEVVSISASKVEIKVFVENKTLLLDIKPYNIYTVEHNFQIVISKGKCLFLFVVRNQYL